MSPPSAESPSATTASRSDSLARSSDASATTVSPSANSPSSATSEISSIASGTRSPSTRRAVELARPRHQVGHRLAGHVALVLRAPRWRPCAAGSSAARARGIEPDIVDGDLAPTDAARRARARTPPTRSRPAPPRRRTCRRRAASMRDRRPSSRSRARPWPAAGARCDRASAAVSTTRVGAVGEQPRQQQRGFDLGAGDRRPMLDASQRRQPARSPAAADARRRARRCARRPARSGSTTRAIGRRRSELSPVRTEKTPAPASSAAQQAHASCPSCRSRARRSASASPRSPATVQLDPIRRRARSPRRGRADNRADEPQSAPARSW